MIRKIYVFLFSFYFSAVAIAQVDHTIKVHYVRATNKQISMAGYEIGSHKISYNICGGIGTGTDAQFVPFENQSDPLKVRDLRGSQTVFPTVLPSNSFLERCVTDYKIKQFRLGFTVFILYNDTTTKHPFTGPHFGIEAMYTSITETQTITFRSNVDETRNSFTGVSTFPAIGAGTHVGWQFAFFKEHVYFDLRAVIPFYFPFTPEPNLNSPFAGNKWEAQVSLGWRFHKDDNEKKVKDSGKGRVRHGI